MDHGSHGSLNHALLMLLCCLLPLVAIGALWVFGIQSSWLVLGAMLLCPLSHLLMMRGHNKENKECHDGKDADKP
jgi:ABC-type transport system involved in cytochrome bd biosynthesis fused ATPase/permease subunit